MTEGWRLIDSTSILRKLLDNHAGYVDVTPDDVRLDIQVDLTEAEAEYLLRVMGFDAAYCDRFFSR